MLILYCTALNHKMIKFAMECVIQFLKILSQFIRTGLLYQLTQREFVKAKTIAISITYIQNNVFIGYR